MLKKLLVLSIMLVGGLTQAEEKGNKLVTSIYFDTGVSKVNDSELAKLKEAAEAIKQEKMVVALIGNADKRGGRLYNLDLADKRANEVKQALMDLGVSEAQLLVNVSQGEEKPLAPADGLKEHLQTNRRVDVVQIKPLTVTKVRTDPVIVPYEVEKLLIRRHRLTFLGGFAPSGVTNAKKLAVNTYSVEEDFDFELGLSYSYLTSVFDNRLSVSGTVYTNKSGFVGLGLDF
jgi:hypothetical protein